MRNPKTTLGAVLIIGVVFLLAIHAIVTSDAVMILGMLTGWVAYAAKDGGA